MSSLRQLLDSGLTTTQDLLDLGFTIDEILSSSSGNAGAACVRHDSHENNNNPHQHRLLGYENEEEEHGEGEEGQHYYYQQQQHYSCSCVLPSVVEDGVAASSSSTPPIIFEQTSAGVRVASPLARPYSPSGGARTTFTSNLMLSSPLALNRKRSASDVDEISLILQNRNATSTSISPLNNSSFSRPNPGEHRLEEVEEGPMAPALHFTMYETANTIITHNNNNNNEAPYYHHSIPPRHSCSSSHRMSVGCEAAAEWNLVEVEEEEVHRTLEGGAHPPISLTPPHADPEHACCPSLLHTPVSLRQAASSLSLLSSPSSAQGSLRRDPSCPRMPHKMVYNEADRPTPSPSAGRQGFETTTAEIFWRNGGGGGGENSALWFSGADLATTGEF